VAKEFVNGVPPRGDSGWSVEISLDVEWAHAMAPGANILLVEANDNSFNNLYDEVQWAASQPGVDVVSMSFGGAENGYSNSLADSIFAAHSGVAFIASSGDDGGNPGVPSVSPYVLAVGGTSLYLDSQGNYLAESAWNGSSGGPSIYERLPSYQQFLSGQCYSRVAPDVAYDADPNTGYWIYDSFANPSAPWETVGGTSAGSPQWAALIAVADQARATAGEAPLGGMGLLNAVYNLPANAFHDITTGNNNSYYAHQGYDFVTGLGSPIADRVVAGLSGVSVATLGAHGTNINASTGAVYSGGVASFTDIDQDSSAADYGATINWGDGQISAAEVVYNGNGTFSVYGTHTYTQAGFYPVTVQIHDVDGTGASVTTVASVADSLSADERFVDQLYKDFLGRSGSGEELNGWVVQLPAAGRGGVSNAIARSEEALKRVIDSMYQQFLGRTADAGGEAAWLNFLQVGGTEEQVMEGLLASAEFAGRATALFGSADANANYIRGLYDLVLGRSASAVEVAGWLGSLPSMGRAGLATLFVTCAEFRSDAVRTYYGNGSQVAEPFFPGLLGRVNPPADGEVSPWVNSGLDLLSMEVSLAASAEYCNHADS